MNRKFVSKSNYVLRKVLNNEENLDIIKDFIETILKIKIEKIILHPYLEKLSNYLPAEENFGIIDVRVIENNGEELNIGIQFIDGYYIQNKMLLYYAQIHANQLEHENQDNIAKTITINLLDFDYFSSKEYHKLITIKENSNYGRVPEFLELHTIELNKFVKNKKIIENKEDAWVAYLEGSDSLLSNYAINSYEKIKKLDDLLDKYWKEETME